MFGNKQEPLRLENSALLTAHMISLTPEILSIRAGSPILEQ
jgi:hypothetical protein